MAPEPLSLSLSLSLSLDARVYYEPARRRRMRVDLSLSLCRQNSRTTLFGLGFRTLNVSVVGEIRQKEREERARKNARAHI
jgi:hypothetical protein